MVSVIIPTLNAEKEIKHLLMAISSQSVKCEVIVIDSSSKDNTVSIAKTFGAKTHVIGKDKFSHGFSRNTGARLAENDILVFMTQDAIPRKNHSIKRIIAPLKDRNIAASYGRHIPKKDAPLPEVFARSFNYPESSRIQDIGQLETLGIKTFFFSNVFSCVKKKEFLEIGGFPEDVEIFEDMIFASKLLEKGYKIAYAADAEVIHSHPINPLKIFIRYCRAAGSLKKYGIITGSGRSEKEGLRYIEEELNFFLKTGSYLWIPYIFVEVFFKFSGFLIGKYFYNR